MRSQQKDKIFLLTQEQTGRDMAVAGAISCGACDWQLDPTALLSLLQAVSPDTPASTTNTRDKFFSFCRRNAPKFPETSTN